MMAWIQELPELPTPVIVVLKMTVLLGAGWLLHVALVRRNPRWRVLVWRGVMAGMVLLPVGELLLPKLQVPVAAPLPAEESVRLVIADERVPPAEPDAYVAPAAPVPLPVDAPEPFSILVWTREHLSFVLLTGWGVVSLILAVRVFSTTHRVRRAIRGCEPASAQIRRAMEKVAADLHCRGRVDLRVTSDLRSPFLAGAIRPVLVLPERMTDENHTAELPAVFAHELAHVRTHDIVWILAGKWLSVLLWFHPLVWTARAAHVAACEQVCDAVAAAYVGGGPTYSQTLARAALELVVDAPALAGIPMIRSSDITRRLRNLKRGIKAAALARPWVAAAAFLGCVTLAALGCVKLVQAERIESSVTVLSEEDETAWGDVCRGAQAGLALEGGKRSFEAGESVTFLVRVRRLSDGPIERFGGGRGLLTWAPIVRDKDGNLMPVLSPVISEKEQVFERPVTSGETLTFKPAKLTIRPVGWQGPIDATSLMARGGEYKVSYIVHVGAKPSGSSDSWLFELTTGEVRLRLVQVDTDSTVKRPHDRASTPSDEEIQNVFRLLGEWVRWPLWNRVGNGTPEHDLVAHMAIGLQHDCEALGTAEIAYLRKVAADYPDHAYRAAARKALRLAEKRNPASEREEGSNRYTFGPVIERWINDNDAGKDFGIDFDSGLLGSPFPAGAKGLDGIVDVSGKPKNIICSDMVVMAADHVWEGDPDAIVKRLEGGKLGSPIYMSAEGELPKSFIFKTYEGGMGVLQILELSDRIEPRGVRIRYKLIREEDAALGTRAQ